MNVVLNPLQGEALIIETDVGNTALSLERGAGLPSECTKTVIQGNIDNVAICRVSRGGYEAGRVGVLVTAYKPVNMFVTLVRTRLDIPV